MQVCRVLLAALSIMLASGCARRPPVIDPAEMETHIDAWEQKLRSGELEQAT